MMHVYRRWLWGFFVLLIASGFMPGALAASMGAPRALVPGALTRMELSDVPVEYTFSPSANGLYAVYFFPIDRDARAAVELWQGDELLVSGEGRMQLVSCRMTADGQYSLRVTGRGAILMEVARETLSRSFGMPLQLADGGGYSKLIARSGDVHWYAMTAEADGAAIIACAPEEPGLRMQAWLFSAGGERLVSAETLASGTAILSAKFVQGETYFVRAAGYGGGTGKYALSALRSENTARPESVQLTDEALEIQGNAAARMSASVWPEEACDLMYMDSTDPSAVRAWRSGYVEGLREGSAMVTVYAYGGARSSCRVTVKPVPLESVELNDGEIMLTEGDSRSLFATLLPANTTQRRVSFASGDEGVASVDRNGVVMAVGVGETVVTVTAENGQSDSAAVVVRPALPRYRALLIGEQEYAPSVETVREGSVKSVESLRSLLNSMSFGGGGFSVETLMDASRDEVLAGVRRTFAGARESDVSLVYITCHGFYQAGMTFFVMTDGSVLSASDLERELRGIPGEIVLLVDCCGSGGVLAEAGTAEDMLEGVANVFQGAVGGASVRGSKYRVIASARLDQDSYRISFGDGGMSTIFARALCDAAGWNMDRNAPSALNADVNYDGLITLDELDGYLSKRVSWYLSLAGGDYAQSVCVYPQADPYVIFARTSE